MNFEEKFENLEENQANEEEEGEDTKENTMDVDDTDTFNKDEQSDEDGDETKKELEHYKDRLLRLTAEYDNFRKRTEKEKLNIYMNATSKAVSAILPVTDSFELAEKACEGSGEEYKKGLSMVKAQLNEALKKLGVEAFGEKGEQFNPDLHNAVSHIEDENAEDNVISEVFQKGYMLKGTVVRHAMVQVTN